MNAHAKKAEQFLKDSQRTAWHDQTLWSVRQKRDKAVRSVPEWEELREHASRLKRHTLSNLENYLIQFESQALKNGAQVHWASDARRFNEIILDIIKRNKAARVVKSKSMLTEECNLNNALEKQGIEVTDTDLGERIIQLRNEKPSHMVLPAIHLKKEEIGLLFHKKLHTLKEDGDPEYLTMTARRHLRDKFLSAQIAITGVNFAVAETGAVVVCTNEGNADMGVHAAPVQIHCMGIEKVIPRVIDLGVFIRLLARSATGQPVTAYTSHYLTPKPGGQMHIVIVDNGRSGLLARENFRNSLKCIRCGACMNTCPVFRKSGGHSYGYVIPGPIGSILAPNSAPERFGHLPFASSLCGSCSDVCPVKIDIHDQLYKWRQEIFRKNLVSPLKRYVLKIAGIILANNKMYHFIKKMMRWTWQKLPLVRRYVWGKERELPDIPGDSFRQWYIKNFQPKGGADG